MKTPYVDISDDVLEMQRQLRYLFEQPNDSWSRQIIACGFTAVEPRPEIPEPILNLHWSLVGDWKYVYFTEIFGVEKSHEKLVEMLSFKANHVKINDFYGGLFNHHLAKEISVKGLNFEDGVRNLFDLLTSEFPTDKDCLEYRLKSIEYFSEIVLLKREVLGNNYQSYQAYFPSYGIHGEFRLLSKFKFSYEIQS